RPLQVTEATVHAAVASTRAEPAVTMSDGLAAGPPDAFLAAWKAIEGNAFGGKVWRAFQVTGARPRLTVAVPTVVPAGSVAESVGWWFEGDRLVGVGETRWTGPTLNLVEWTVPPDVVVTELTARSLLGWSQTGGRVQGWFDRPATDPVVTWRALKVGGPA